MQHFDENKLFHIASRWSNTRSIPSKDILRLAEDDMTYMLFVISELRTEVHNLRMVKGYMMRDHYDQKNQDSDF